jgi:competence protein ComEA
MMSEWFNKIATRAALLRSELLILSALFGFLCLGIALNAQKNWVSKDERRARAEESQFIGLESDSALSAEMAMRELMRQSTRSVAKEKLNLNTATEAELEALPEIGATLANRLIRFRQFKGGRINSLDELLEVKGIDPPRLARLKAVLDIK